LFLRVVWEKNVWGNQPGNVVSRTPRAGGAAEKKNFTPTRARGKPGAGGAPPLGFAPAGPWPLGLWPYWFGPKKTPGALGPGFCCKRGGETLPRAGANRPTRSALSGGSFRFFSFSGKKGNGGETWTAAFGLQHRKNKKKPPPTKGRRFFQGVGGTNGGGQAQDHRGGGGGKRRGKPGRGEGGRPKKKKKKRTTGNTAGGGRQGGKGEKKTQ